MTSKTYDDFQILGSEFDYIPAKELESRLETIREENESEGGIFDYEISVIEEILQQFEANGDSPQDLIRYTELNRSWVVEQLKDIYNFDTDDLIEPVRQSLDWDELKNNLITGHYVKIDIEGIDFYYRDTEN